MRALGKIACGLGAAASLYFCVDFLVMYFRHGTPSDAPNGHPTLARDDDLSRVERMASHLQPPPHPIAEQPVATVPAASAPARKESPAEHPEPDKSAELASTLEGQYAVDARGTRESASKERALEGLFSQPELDGKARLEEVNCRQSICRGVIRIANAQSDNEVFSRTFLSQQFMGAIPDAVTVASRQKLSDGSIAATFYIHPQSIFQMVAQ